MHKILIICGPTATGKTKLGLSLAKKFNGEVVGADSRHVYKGLDVLTGKDISPGIRIWMTDVVEPREKFSVAHYVTMGRRIVADIWKRKKLPIVVGGTGFYIDALVGNFKNITIPPNQKLRKKLSVLNISALQKKVAYEKLQSMNESDRQNPRRLIRAIEIALWQKQHAPSTNQWKPFEALWIGLRASMSVIEKRLKKRIASRWAKAVKEVQLPHKDPTLGVSAINRYLSGTLSKKEAQEAWFRAERAYVKRQMTWFKKKSGIHWFDISQKGFEDDILKLLYEQD